MSLSFVDHICKEWLEEKKVEIEKQGRFAARLRDTCRAHRKPVATPAKLPNRLKKMVQEAWWDAR
jgi:hypothetical protein